MNSEVKKVEKNPYQYNGDYTLIDKETNSNSLLEKIFISRAMDVQ